MRQLVLEAALLAYPREFRGLYRAQILDDLDEGHARTLPAAAGLFVSGLTMRAEIFVRDAGYALRRLWKMPLFAAIVALTFALGIGANVAVFSVLNAVLLRPLPYPNASRLVVLRVNSVRQTGSWFSIPELNDFTQQSRTIEDIAASTPDSLTFTAHGKTKSVFVDAVTSKYFDALGVRPQLGRFFTRSDARAGVSGIVLSDALWRSAFNADPRIAGKAVRASGRTFTVVGVAPRGLQAPDVQEGVLGTPGAWEAMNDRAPAVQRGARYVGLFGILRPGVSLSAANADLALISDRLQRLYPAFENGNRFHVQTLAQAVLGGVSSALWTLFAAVIAILIVTCANVASMLVAGASSRDHEFAVRASLGASRRGLAAQLLVETGALALLGGIAGVAIAYASLTGLRAIFSAVPRIAEAQIDVAALVYAAGIVLFCTLLSGLWPILALPLRRLAPTLKASTRGGAGAAGARLRSALIVTEIAVSLALVIVSGLLVRSLYSLVHADIGIRPQGVLVSSLIGLPSARYGSLDARAAFSRRLFASVKSLPGVDEAALAVSYPLSDLLMQFSIGIAGRTFPPNEQPAAMSDIVTPQYFDAMGIPLVRGRAFTPNDNAAARPVAIVNQTFGRMYARGGDAIGMRIVVPGFNGSTSATRTVVGIAGDTRTSLADAAKPQVYVPMEQSPTNLLSIVVRSRLPAAQLTNAVDKALAQMEPLLSPPAMQTYGDIVAEHSQQPRSMATLLTVLALLALLLALSGIFGVVSYNVMQRHAEFGLRAALGARQRDLLIDVVARVLGVTAIGILAGVTLAALGAQAVRPQLYATSPLDPATFSIVVVLIAGCAIAAALAPAVRAMRVDPAQALRYE